METQKSLHSCVVTSLDHIGSVCTFFSMRWHTCGGIFASASTQPYLLQEDSIESKMKEGARQHTSTHINTLQKRGCIQRIKEKTRMFWLSWPFSWCVKSILLQDVATWAGWILVTYLRPIFAQRKISVWSLVRVSSKLGYEPKGNAIGSWQPRDQLLYLWKVTILEWEI